MTSDKIFLLDFPDDIIKSWHQNGDKIVFTNGCFDLLHKGHIVYLEEAKSLGDKLIVGLNSDASVNRLKGNGRPIQKQDSRSVVLAALECVDLVILFEEDTPLNIILKAKPNILEKGGDYKLEDIVGYKEVKEMGGKTVCLSFLEGFSTSGIEKKILADNA